MRGMEAGANGKEDGEPMKKTLGSVFAKTNPILRSAKSVN
jgi:hypothetical protein